MNNFFESTDLFNEMLTKHNEIVGVLDEKKRKACTISSSDSPEKMRKKCAKSYSYGAYYYPFVTRVFGIGHTNSSDSSDSGESGGGEGGTGISEQLEDIPDEETMEIMYQKHNEIVSLLDADKQKKCLIDPADTLDTLKKKCAIAYKYGAYYFPLLVILFGFDSDESEPEVPPAHTEKEPSKKPAKKAPSKKTPKKKSKAKKKAKPKSSTERVRRYYRRHPDKVRKYLKKTVKDRVARNRDRAKAVQKYGKSKMKNHDVHHPNGPNGGSWRLAKKDHGPDKKNETYVISEGISESRSKIFTNFSEYVKKKLKIKEMPKIHFINDENYGSENASLGAYSPDQKVIYVAVTNRLAADVLRTLAHELVHHKQNELGKIKEGHGKTGDSIENQANAIAGILMRDYGKNNRQIYTESVEVI